MGRKHKEYYVQGFFFTSKRFIEIEKGEKKDRHREGSNFQPPD